jgi:AP-3 complex subunit sigma
MVVNAVLIINNAGKPRLSKFYEPYPPTHIRTALVQQIFHLLQPRPDDLCNFVDIPNGPATLHQGKTGRAGVTLTSDSSLRVVYRHYATLYFCFVVDEAESELGILDLIQVFVEALDRCFENVCELDLIFHFDEVHLLLSCIIVSGMVLDVCCLCCRTAMGFEACARPRSTLSPPTSSSTCAHGGRPRTRATSPRACYRARPRRPRPSTRARGSGWGG